MKNETKHLEKYILPLLTLAAVIVIVGALYDAVPPELSGKTPDGILEEKVLPSGEVLLPVTWGGMGVKLANAGVIDAERFREMYEKRGEFTDEYESLLSGRNNGRIKITKDNAPYLLNLFWALGLANKNPILDYGEMTDKRYGGAETFASTAGWTMAEGNPMDHYSMHEFLNLTPGQQALAEKVSKGIYRPCCGNSTHFPDCNHGMAMLGLLELMASQGVSEKDMWKAALSANSFWFPDAYLTIAAYLKGKSVDWRSVDARKILGDDYSSSSGYTWVVSQIVKPEQENGGKGCGI
ncbi:MAG: hypothetical protein AAB355_00540 [Patescibacteria group bacterium]